MIPSVMLGPLRIARMGRETFGRIAGAETAQGRVHSVFDRAINILWPDGHLLALHGQAPLAAPFAVAMTEWPPRGAVAPGMPFPRSLLDWSQSESVALEMPRGLLAFDVETLRAPAGARTLGSGAGLRARRALARGLEARDAAIVVDAACRLIGLGEGLTPAGDDCVVGALAAVHRLAPGWLLGDPAPRHRLAAAARERTTDVARDFLLEALEGRFAEPVLVLLAAQSGDEAARAARELLATGGTSGADTLGGIRLACRALVAPSPALT